MDTEQNKERNFPPADFGQPPAPGVKVEEMRDAKFVDYVEVGKVVVNWAKDKTIPRPTDRVGFEAALGGRYHLPPQVKSVEYIDGSDEVFRLRLPAPQQVTESETHAKANNYSVPPVIRYLNEVDTSAALVKAAEAAEAVAATAQKAADEALAAAKAIRALANAAAALADNDGSVVNMLYARVADYTMRQCR